MKSHRDPHLHKLVHGPASLPRLRTIFADKTYTPPEMGNLPPDLQRWPIGWYLTSPASFFITFMFVLSFLLVMPSVIFLRGWHSPTSA
jgi:hypothetical protein